jgi:hypothetical protein
MPINHWQSRYSVLTTTVYIIRLGHRKFIAHKLGCTKDLRTRRSTTASHGKLLWSKSYIGSHGWEVEEIAHRSLLYHQQRHLGLGYEVYLLPLSNLIAAVAAAEVAADKAGGASLA